MKRIKAIPWSDNRCIFCLETGPLTYEHVIPRSLGGKLVCRFICKPCNDKFGSEIDAGAKVDPRIRIAARRTGGSISKLVAKIEEGQRYLIQTKPALLEGTLRNGEVVGAWKTLSDGSRIAPEEQALVAVRGMMREEGCSAKEIEEAISRYLRSDYDERVDLTETLYLIKRQATVRGPSLKAAQASDLLFIKIAFEFVALTIGGAIYQDIPTFREIRRAIRGRDLSVFKVERLEAEETRPFHGLVFEGNDPYAVVQIRLFGKPAYRVHMIGVAIDYPPMVYTHDLLSGEHWSKTLAAEAA